jgi:hypothetical protein
MEEIIVMKMEQDYIYDIFLSYRRRPPVGDWVKHHFYPLLRNWLSQAMPQDPEIFIDVEEIETGSQWSLRLQNALKNSRCLVPVWSPDYFRSSWCWAELQSMMKRESLLGFRTHENPAGLIYPVVFSDGEHFPTEAKGIQNKDLRKWNISSEVFRETRAYADFEKEVQLVAEEIGKMLQTAPDWQENWPVVTPDDFSTADTTTLIKLPRLQ